MFTHHSCKRTNGGLKNIRNLKSSRIFFISCSHRTDYRDTCLLCSFHKRKFAGYCVNCIYHIIILCKIKKLLCFRQEKSSVFSHCAFRVYIKYPLFCSIHLIHTDSAMKCDYLSVKVTKCYCIIVDNIYTADSASCKSFNSISSHSAYTKHGNS